MIHPCQRASSVESMRGQGIWGGFRERMEGGGVHTLQLEHPQLEQLPVQEQVEQPQGDMVTGSDGVGSG